MGVGVNILNKQLLIADKGWLGRGLTNHCKIPSSYNGALTIWT